MPAPSILWDMRYANIKHECNHNIWKKKLLVVIFDHFFIFVPPNMRAQKLSLQVFSFGDYKTLQVKKKTEISSASMADESYSLFFHGWLRWFAGVTNVSGPTKRFRLMKNASLFSLWMQRVYIKTTCNLQDYMKIRGNLINNNENNIFDPLRITFDIKNNMYVYMHTVYSNKTSVIWCYMYVC